MAGISTTLNTAEAILTTEIFLNPGNDSDDGRDSDMVGILPKTLYLIGIYFISIVGLIGNILIFVLMQQKWSRSLSYSVYLRCLAILDSGVLIFTCMEDILDHQFDTLREFLTSDIALCKLWRYVQIVTRFISPWFIVALTTDRLVTIVFPRKQSILCSLKAAIIVSASLILLALIEAIYAFTSISIREEDGLEYCIEDDDEDLTNYLYVENLLLQSLLPCVIILVLNIRTIVEIRRINLFGDSLIKEEKERRWKVIKVTISLIAVSLMAFVTLVPKASLEVAEYFWEVRYDDDVEEAIASNSTVPEKPGYLKVANDTWPLLNLIALINFGQNFYVMMITGPKYREALRAMCRRRRHLDTEIEFHGITNPALDTRQASVSSSQH